MTSIEKIESYLIITIAEEFKPTVQTYIDAINAFIERYTGRVFTVDEEATPRLYDGSGTDEIYIDDAVEITKVEINDTETTDFTAYPYNRLPKTRIILNRAIYRLGNQNVRVTAKWGYPVTPDLEFAATVMAAGIINSQNTDEKDVLSETIGRYSVSYRSGSTQQHDFQNAKDILKLYKRYL